MIDHSNCGIGAIANLSGEYSHEIIQQGMTLLKSLSHRGGKSSDGTGDGCGILMQIPNNFYQTKHNITQPFAVMMAFLPNNDFNRGEAVESIQNIATQYKLPIIKEIEVPVNSTILKPKAKACEPIVMQYIFDMTGHEEAILYTVRRKIEQAWKRAKLADSTCYIASCSTQTIVYKGLLTPDELPHYYLDLQDPAFDSNFCIVHQRFSTNTNPSWNLAQPFRYLAHNGEINTVSGNIQWSNAKKGLTGFSELYPICNERHSDSANLDRTLESMLFERLNLENAVTRLLPKAYESDTMLSDDIKAYYEYSGLKNEPWDGPAGVIICDGHKLIATLDRNGLRPFRYAMTDDQIILASEIGVLDTPLQDIKVASRIQASEILCVDLDNSTITKDEEVKAMLSNQHPYRRWLAEKIIEVPVVHDNEISVNNMARYESKFKYTKAEYAQEIKSLLETGKEAIGSFAYTAPLNMLQPQVGLFFDYFKQNFAQVTNPPLDSIREQSVFSSVVNFTSVSSLQDEALTYPIYKFNSPVITKNQFEAIAHESKFECVTLSLQFVGNLRLAISKLKQEVEAVLSTGCRVIILDDQGEEKCMPSLLATSIVQSVLVESGRRLEVRLVVKCADARLPIHYAMLVAYGADVVYPYFAFDFLKTKAATLEDELAVSLDRYLEGCNQALLKLMAKMGVATVASYRGSKVYEVVGLDDEMTSLFTAKASLFGGVSMDDIDASLALADNCDLNKINEYQNMDSTFMNHAYSKGFIKDVKVCISGENFDRFKEIMASERRRHINIRDCFDYKLANAVKIDEVQSETEIIKHFVASAMSYGALSIEAHETIARAFNELGAASNSGEGGELVERFGTLAASKIKQVASGRFGVTYDYLRSAQEIQIKMAQGAKPGEGGHLPKQKVDENIARVRYAKQGVDLISPPPHHDIYSIEDLAQLIYDLQSTNPSSLISVKLASLFNVGTIANGVVKAGATKVVISGFNGGTGASPKSSLKYTGLPWEYGLYQTHVNLLQNDVRTKTLIQVDGQIKSGYDVIAAAILGADEFGIGTMALIGVDCIGCKMCHTNKCPKGITTQDTTLRQKLNTDTTPLKTYLTYLARQTRELMAAMGVKSLQELRGRTDLISISNNNPYHLTLNWLEAHPCTESVTLQTPDYSRDILQPDSVNVIKSTQRTLGVGLVSDKVQTFKTYGYAGQSYGAFMNQTVNLIHEGYANDYVGKGLSGGLVVVKVDETIRELSLQNPEMINEHFIAGNTILYGATEGSCYIEGRVGERFAVRNSGVTAVNHGMGVHACEYMTGGVVVSLGGVEGNIGAGMTGGLLFVYKPSNLVQKLNTSYVGIYEMTDAHVAILKQTLQDYVSKTGNVLASNILANFEQEVSNFNLVTSADYYQLSL